MELSFGSIYASVWFEDGVVVLFFKGRGPVAMCAGHPDWTPLAERRDLFLSIDAGKTANHSKGIYYLGVTERIVF